MLRNTITDVNDEKKDLKSDTTSDYNKMMKKQRDAIVIDMVRRRLVNEAKKIDKEITYEEFIELQFILLRDLYVVLKRPYQPPRFNFLCNLGNDKLRDQNVNVTVFKQENGGLGGPK